MFASKAKVLRKATVASVKRIFFYKRLQLAPFSNPELCKTLWSFALQYYRLAELGTEGPPYTAASEYKLFFEGKSDEDYAELFLNINAKDNWIELREKDEDYRPYLLHFLTH